MRRSKPLARDYFEIQLKFADVVGKRTGVCFVRAVMTPSVERRGPHPMRRRDNRQSYPRNSVSATVSSGITSTSPPAICRVCSL